ETALDTMRRGAGARDRGMVSPSPDASRNFLDGRETRLAHRPPSTGDEHNNDAGDSAMAEMDDLNQVFDVQDTKSSGDRTKYAALVRAILNLTPRDVKGFITCALRYTLTLENGCVTECSPSLPHTQITEGYEDDDYLPGVGPPRLGGCSRAS